MPCIRDVLPATRWSKAALVVLPSRASGSRSTIGRAQLLVVFGNGHVHIFRSFDHCCCQATHYVPFNVTMKEPDAYYIVSTGGFKQMGIIGLLIWVVCTESHDHMTIVLHHNGVAPSRS